jgi:hypothetical protein
MPRQRAMLWSANTEGVGKVNIDDWRSAERGLASEACAKATTLNGKARMVEVDKYPGSQ